MTRESELVRRVRACRLCAGQLPLGPRPILQLDPAARILIAGQAPGRRTHQEGVPFRDPSGDRLRDWLGLPPETFYDPRRIAILPMGFCYPGTGRSGDLPPRPECALAWRDGLLRTLVNLRLTVVIGRFAHDYHLPGNGGGVTATVRGWRAWAPENFPLPHPSPRNNAWLRRHPWFATELLPELRRRVAHALRD